MSQAEKPCHLSVLVSHGCNLAALLRKKRQRSGGWMNETATTTDIDPEKIVADITHILEEFKKGKQSLEDKGLSKVIRRIGGIFRELIKDEPSSKNFYGKLVEEIDEGVNNLIKSPKKTSSSVITSPTASASVRDSFQYQVNQREYVELDSEAAYENLDRRERICLSFCHSFFSTFVNSVEINRRELIHWWIGLEIISDHLEGEKVLRNLVAEELLVHPVNDKGITLCKRYTMPYKSKSMPENDYNYIGTQKEHLFVSSTQKIIPQGITKPYVYKLVFVGAINTTAYTLNARLFDCLLKLKNVRLVHLGSWHQDMDYIVVEDMIIKMSAFKELKAVRFLSLQGISRLQELPTSVYSLTNLLILDLRACQDLNKIPKGIELLKYLQILDLSQCYELHFIPREIALLSELKVLKGFVIDQLDSSKLAAFFKKKKSSSSCPFTHLSTLKKLQKLSIRTRLINFPSSKDVETLYEMKELYQLKITWVRGSRSNSETPLSEDNQIKRFPTNLIKLVLQAAPEAIASRLLGLIANRSNNRLQKLYVRGGGLWKLDHQRYCFPNVKVIRFRYLPKLHMNWYQFKLSFPKLTRLEIFNCPHLIFFPSDENGVWEEDS
ncbi:hypothetical protein SOVF_009560 [Spinacia oleracea]|uniref:Disease resistance RPP13-like protein 4 n=1 Tax=Spinacia oleracea TaxID=3562 RepID=A0A9R0KCY5_SPIOL|nr:disease resistance RPP13-like protein 4 [Spinacia oleracea]KNA25132.1 hypothetical protein SOVF_009560 [Spinacia oleracea]